MLNLPVSLHQKLVYSFVAAVVAVACGLLLLFGFYRARDVRILSVVASCRNCSAGETASRLQVLVN